jgi:hypothetical protein
MQKSFYLSIALFVAVMVLFSVGAKAAPAPEDVLRMTIDDLKAQLTNPDLAIVDVRSTHDWEGATTLIKGAVREDPMKLGQWIEKYPKEKTIVLYCA